MDRSNDCIEDSIQRKVRAKEGELVMEKLAKLRDKKEAIEYGIRCAEVTLGLLRELDSVEDVGGAADAKT